MGHGAVKEDTVARIKGIFLSVAEQRQNTGDHIAASLSLMADTIVILRLPALQRDPHYINGMLQIIGDQQLKAVRAVRGDGAVIAAANQAMRR